MDQDAIAALGGLITLVVVVFGLVLIVLGILMPIFVYSAQRSAKRCVRQLEITNGYLRQLLEAKAAE